MPHDHTPAQHGLLFPCHIRKTSGTHLSVHLPQRSLRHLWIISRTRIIPGMRFIKIFKIRQIDINQPIEHVQRLHRHIAARIIDKRQCKSTFFCAADRLHNLWNIMIRCHQVDIIGSFLLQFKKDIHQPVSRDCLADGSMRNRLILAINTPQLTAGKKYRSTPCCTTDTRFLPEMKCCTRQPDHIGLPTDTTRSPGAVDATCPRAEPAATHLHLPFHPCHLFHLLLSARTRLSHRISPL